jgi:amidase
MGGYSDLDCVALVKAISNGSTTAVEVRDACFEALEAIDGYNVVDEIYFNRPPNEHRGLLVGVPILHKDSGAQLAGEPQHLGSRLAPGLIPTTTSQALATIEREGANIVGRSRIPEFYLSITGDNESLGSTQNPFDRRFSMGGTTAGLAAVALGAVPVAHGADSGGSLRIPASWAGCYTMKPTYGAISGSPVGSQLIDLNQIFVGTRSLRDLRLFYRLLSAPADDDIPPRPDIDHGWAWRRTGRTCLISSFFSGLSVDTYHLEAVRRAGTRLSALGWDVEELDLDLDFSSYCEAMYVIFSADLRVTVDSARARAYGAVERLCQPYVARWYEESKELNASQLYMAVEHVRTLRRVLTRSLRKYDFAISPVTAMPPPLIDTLHRVENSRDSRELNEQFEKIVHFTAALNMSGHPALVIPYSRHAFGVPIGIQLIGQHGADLALLEIAELLDDGFRRPAAYLDI